MSPVALALMAALIFDNAAEVSAPPLPPSSGPSSTSATVEATPEPAPPPFDPSRIEVDPKVRLEVTTGLWLVDQASHLKTSNPMLGVGVTGRQGERLRWDLGYRFTAGSSGTRDLNVFNTFHALRAGAHYAYPLGGFWMTAGGGPVAYLVTSSTSVQGRAVDGGLAPAFGVQVLAGAETQVNGTLIRFEAGAATRHRRLDALAAISVGF